MLTQVVESYLVVRRAAGFDLRNSTRMLPDFARFAMEGGDTYIRATTAIAWAAGARSVRQRDRRLKEVVRLARHARAENAAHEVPPSNVFAVRYARPRAHIFTGEELRQILTEAGRLGPEGSLRPHTYRTLFGLLASCGLRISEALALRVNDVAADGLFIRKTKFRKSRLVPMHPTTERAVEDYLHRRRRQAGQDNHVFVSIHGRGLARTTASGTFLTILRKLGLRGPPGEPGPHLHELRHTMAVRALEDCPRHEIAKQMLSLSTYLGHARVADTYWYLQATPRLMADVADACRSYLRGETA